MIKYKTKPLSLEQRIEVNDLMTEMNPTTGTIIVRDVFRQRVKYLRYGLASLGDVELTDENVDAEINKLTNDEIEKISDAIAEETNLSKKKKSKSD